MAREVHRLAALTAVIAAGFAVRGDDPPGAAAKKLGASLDGCRYEFPCKGRSPLKSGADCASAIVTGDPKTTDNFTATKKFEGDAGANATR